MTKNFNTENLEKHVLKIDKNSKIENKFDIIQKNNFRNDFFKRTHEWKWKKDNDFFILEKCIKNWQKLENRK